jgi:hypothetical protein
MTDTTVVDGPLMTRAQVLERARNEIGLPVSRSWFDKKSAPGLSSNRPPVAARWGRRDLYDARVFEWLRAQLRAAAG